MQRAVHAIAAWWRHLGPNRPQSIDVGLAAVVAAAVSITIGVATVRYPDARTPDAFAYALAVTIGAFVLARRRWPVGVLMATFLTLQVYYWANYPSIWPAVALAVPLYAAAAAGHLRWALAVIVWYWVVPLILTGVGLLGPLATTINDLVRDGSIMIASLLFGDAVAAHRALEIESAARMRRMEAERRRVETERQREAQELRAARVIQLQLLPKEVPSLPGWRLADYYQPARAVGGDFYDFLKLDDGQVAVITGDVTDKGIPAALVMATTHSILRGDTQGAVSPGTILKRANDRLYLDTPSNMFVTCLYVVLDPVSGRLRYANAGHNLPYLATADGVRELRATGMPLGALPDMTYEEQETYLAPGDNLLLHSDGLVEAHNPAGEMFGFPRLQEVVAKSNGSDRLIDACLAALRTFVGREWEQEDDITLVTLQREGRERNGMAAEASRQRGGSSVWRTLAELAVPSEPGNERRALEEVATSVEGIGLSQRSLDRLKTAVAEATMNAMEHGNKYRKEAPVLIRVAASADALSVRITDEGSGPLDPDPETPDLAAKLESRQKARGWGLFLIENMVDEMNVTSDSDHHTVELIVHLDDQPEGRG